MRNNYFPHLLLGRKLGNSRQQRIRESVEDQTSFDELFRLVFHHEKLVAQRAIRAVLKVVKSNPGFIQSHTEQLLTVLRSPDHREIKSLFIELIPKVELDRIDVENVWHMLVYLALNHNEQRMIRTHALQSLYELSVKHNSFRPELLGTLNLLANDLTPSVHAKVLRIKSLLHKKETVKLSG